LSTNYALKLNKGLKKTVGTVLHGAYGDYFEQLLCFTHLAKCHPEHDFIVFFANEYRMKEFTKLNYVFAKKIALASEIENTEVDIFYQFQAKDKELQEGVFDKLSMKTLAKFDFQHNLLPHVYMRSIKNQFFDLSFNKQGIESIERISKTLPEEFFDAPTIGFMWRYRKKGGAIKPYFMPEEVTLVEKYSEIFDYAINELNCNVLVAGMNVKTTDENRFFVDAKFPEFSLNLKSNNLSYLPGKSWLAEVEILSKCDIIICNPSGFSEAIHLLGKKCILVDPPLDYMLKMLKNRAPVFNIGIQTFSQINELLLNIFQLKSKSYLKKVLAKHFDNPTKNKE